MTAAFGLSITAEAEVTHADPTITDQADEAEQED